MSAFILNFLGEITISSDLIFYIFFVSRQFFTLGSSKKLWGFPVDTIIPFLLLMSDQCRDKLGPSWAKPSETEFYFIQDLLYFIGWWKKCRIRLKFSQMGQGLGHSWAWQYSCLFWLLPTTNVCKNTLLWGDRGQMFDNVLNW